MVWNIPTMQKYLMSNYNDGGFGKGKVLVHRDLKPGNIFLTRVKDEVIVKVGDYGLQKPLI